MWAGEVSGTPGGALSEPMFAASEALFRRLFGLVLDAVDVLQLVGELVEVLTLPMVGVVQAVMFPAQVHNLFVELLDLHGRARVTGCSSLSLNVIRPPKIFGQQRPLGRPLLFACKHGQSS